MNQSVIVFADSAARTSAIPSPVEGMLTYLEDTNAYESWNGSAFVALAEEPDLTSLIPKSTVTTSQDLIVADGASSVTRLGVGTDDQVLSVVAGAVAWADAGGGSMSLISSATATGSSITFSSIPATYKDLVIEITNLRTSSNANLLLSFNSSSYALQNWNDAKFSDEGFSATPITLSNGPTNYTSNSFVHYIIRNYAGSTWKIGEAHAIFPSTSATRFKNAKDVFYANQSSAITSVTLATTSDMTNGTIFIYGVN
jgi:hypothetical protein